MVINSDIKTIILITTNIITLILYLSCFNCQNKNDCITSEQNYVHRNKIDNIYREKRELINEKGKFSESDLRSRTKRSFLPKNKLVHVEIIEPARDFKPKKHIKTSKFQQISSAIKFGFNKGLEETMKKLTQSHKNSKNGNKVHEDDEQEMIRNVFGDISDQISLEGLTALNQMTNALRDNMKLQRLIFQLTVGWFNSEIHDYLVMGWNSTINLWLMKDLNEQGDDDSEENNDVQLKADQSSYDQISNTDLNFSNKTYKLCETLTEKEMYKRFVFKNEKNKREKSGELNDDSDEDVMVKAENPRQTRKGVFKIVSGLFTGVVSGATNIVGSLSSKFGGPTGEELMKDVIDKQFNKVQDMVEGKQDLTIDMANAAPVPIDSPIDKELVMRSRDPFLVLAKCVLKEGFSLKQLKKSLLSKVKEN